MLTCHGYLQHSRRPCQDLLLELGYAHALPLFSFQVYILEPASTVSPKQAIMNYDQAFSLIINTHEQTILRALRKSWKSRHRIPKLSACSVLATKARAGFLHVRESLFSVEIKCTTCNRWSLKPVHNLRHSIHIPGITTPVPRTTDYPWPVALDRGPQSQQAVDDEVVCCQVLCISLFLSRASHTLSTSFFALFLLPKQKRPEPAPAPFAALPPLLLHHVLSFSGSAASRPDRRRILLSTSQAIIRHPFLLHH